MTSKKFTVGILFGMLLLGVPFQRAHSAVVVFDRITIAGTPARLVFLTKGKFFAKGGKRVDVTLAEKETKRILTGGDGYGYLTYTPEKPGITRIEARSEGDTATGILLAMDPDEKAILIDLEGGFKNYYFSEEEKSEVRAALETIKQKFAIIYLSRYLGRGISKGLLKKENLPESVVFRWRGSKMFAALKEMGIRIHAIIGSADIMTAAKKDIENRYSFEKTKDGKTVKGWDEIVKLLIPKTDSEPQSDNHNNWLFSIDH